MYCFLSRFAGARFSLNKQAECPIVFPLATRGLYLRAHESAIISSGHSGLSSVFPANERGARHSHLHKESDEHGWFSARGMGPGADGLGCCSWRPHLHKESDEHGWFSARGMGPGADGLGCCSWRRLDLLRKSNCAFTAAPVAPRACWRPTKRACGRRLHGGA